MEMMGVCYGIKWTTPWHNSYVAKVGPRGVHHPHHVIAGVKNASKLINFLKFFNNFSGRHSRIHIFGEENPLQKTLPRAPRNQDSSIRHSLKASLEYAEEDAGVTSASARQQLQAYGINKFEI